jgi:FKBP-type peptidyl-prolyl cis-trans isomerase 2
MEIGDFVEVDYVGRIKGTNEIFDLTKEEVAKKEKFYSPRVSYKPVVLILGADFIIKGLDEALRGMKVGEKKTIDVPPEKAFGNRKDELVQTVPASKFKGQETEPFPGATITIGNMRGRILSVDGGRIKIDFNHPLAGKTLEYEIELRTVIEKKEEQVKAVFEYFTGIKEVDALCKGLEADVTVMKDVDVVRPIKSMVAQAVIKWVKGVETVKFIEVFDKSKFETEEHDHDGTHQHVHEH